MTSQEKFFDALSEHEWEIEVQYVVGGAEHLPIERYRALLAKGVLVDPVHKAGLDWGTARFNVCVIKGRRSGFEFKRGKYLSKDFSVHAAFYEYNGALAEYLYVKPVLADLLSKIARHGKDEAALDIAEAEQAVVNMDNILESRQEKVDEELAQIQDFKRKVCGEVGITLSQLEALRAGVLKLVDLEERNAYSKELVETSQELLARRQETLKLVRAAREWELVGRNE